MPEYTLWNRFNGLSTLTTDLTKKGQLTMSTHSYSRIWIHLIWETLRREQHTKGAPPIYTRLKPSVNEMLRKRPSSSFVSWSG